MKKNPGARLVVVWLGLLTGTLDAIGALLWSYGTSPAIIFKYIASGVFGKAAFNGGWGMVWAGLFFHYLIAYSFSTVFFILYPAIIRVLKNKYITAVVFALITWLITNLVIVPLSQIGWRSMSITHILVGFGILIFTIGLPIALICDRIYSKQSV